MRLLESTGSATCGILNLDDRYSPHDQKMINDSAKSDEYDSR